VVTWRSRLWLLYWVSTAILKYPPFTRLDRYEVDQPVVAPERDGRLGPVGGQRREPLPLPAREHDPEDVRPRHHDELYIGPWRQ